MSKNVAVFVDVANIFYAAKAAGVDIDYVTLLKSAVAGRDFVRAYAYTGLDPENENQRQFHAFLARNGYKVVSKDIRKYGDGRIKANLDIELVVDMMRTSRNLDVAVVVSGDGDFAPAIRAVQQMGVRVEVISFRGNTSSDLMEVADVFTDISQIARVEKGSSRSGRRVAAEDDLSMTEVPDKETEGSVRRRRGGRGRGAERVGAERVGAERTDDRAARLPISEIAGMPGNLIVLPGERLSRVGSGGAANGSTSLPIADGMDAALEPFDDGEEAIEASGEGPAAEAPDDGRRRRRRRGGRGRGRGRGPEAEAAGPPAVVPLAADAEDDDLDAEPEAIRLPQHSTFGSVWDTQLGVAPAPLAAATGDLADEEYDDEPEIPEYLLAERRRPAGRPNRGSPGGPGRVMGGRARPGGRQGGYQSAVDRVQYGRGGSSLSTPPYSPPPREPREAREPREDRTRNRPPRGPRPDRPIFEPRAAEAAPSAPWSEVPPEVEELLRAELARRGTPPPPPSGRPVTATPGSFGGIGGDVSAGRQELGAPEAVGSGSIDTEEPPEPVEAIAPEAALSPATVAPTSRRRTPRRAAAAETEAAEAADAAPATPPRRTTRRKAEAPAAEAGSEDTSPTTAETDAEPKPRRRTTRKTAATVEDARVGETAADQSAGEATAEPKPRATRRRTTCAPAEPTA